VLAAFDDVLGPPGSHRIEGQHAAGCEPVEHHPNGRKVLFHGRGGLGAAEVVEPVAAIEVTPRASSQAQNAPTAHTEAQHLRSK
jgi:hypothetical protein